MDAVLIVGVESIAGAGLAAALRETHRVTGLSCHTDAQIDDCRIVHLESADAASINEQVDAVRPAWIVFCGHAARSSWDTQSEVHGFDDVLAIDCAQAAARCGAEFTMLSSDSVFVGPWMSHTEGDEHFSSLPAAVRLREIESSVLSEFPSALVVRTNVFGWNPGTSELGFASQLLAEIERGLAERVDFLKHATPILATDLGGLLLKARQTGVCGILHLGGAERLSPYQFAERLAAVADRSAAIIPDETLLAHVTMGRDRGETTLDCSTARELLGASMPLLEDGLCAFLAQRPDAFEEAARRALPASV
ncbi:MAG: sugar nucleotide-binding protein [Planctomycetota bacterium]|jgi:dTDP-4-dehydrorhamnose reductase